MPQLGSSLCQRDPGGHQHSTENVPWSLWQLYKGRLIFLLAKKSGLEGITEWAFLLGNHCWRWLRNIQELLTCTLFSQNLHQSRGISWVLVCCKIRIEKFHLFVVKENPSLDTCSIDEPVKTAELQSLGDISHNRLSRTKILSFYHRIPWYWLGQS